MKPDDALVWLKANQAAVKWKFIRTEDMVYPTVTVAVTGPAGQIKSTRGTVSDACAAVAAELDSATKAVYEQNVQELFAQS